MPAPGWYLEPRLKAPKVAHHFGMMARNPQASACGRFGQALPAWFTTPALPTTPHCAQCEAVVGGWS